MATRDVNISITASDKTGSAFNSVQNSLGRLNSSVSSVTGAVAKLTGVFAAIGATAFIKQTIDAADSLAKLAQKTGVAVDTLSALSNAADLAGLSQDQLGSSLIKLNRSIAEAVSGSREQIDAFAGLGISVRDAAGNIKATDVVLAEIADRFSKASDGATKTQYAVALFGKSGADLIPLLNEGSAGLKEFGASIGENFAKEAEKFNDNLTKIKQGLQGFIAGGTPVLEWANAFFSIISGKGVSGALGISPVDELRLQIFNLQKEVDKLIKGSMEPNGLFVMQQLPAKLKQLEELKKRLAEIRGEQEKTTKNEQQKKELAPLPNKEVLDSLSKQKDEVTKLLKGEIEMKVLQFERLGASKDQVAEFRKLVTQAEKLVSLDRQLEDAGKEMDQLWKNRTDLEKEAKKEVQDSLSPLGKMNIEMAKYASWRSQGIITAEKEFELLNALFDKTEEFNQTIKTEGFGAAMERGMRTYYNSIKDISGLMEDAVVGAFYKMEDALVNFVKTGKLDFTDFANSVINDIIRIQVRQSITEPLNKALSGGIGSVVGNLFGGSGSQSPAPVVNRDFSFAGGGYTGSGVRSGGIDGMGGFPAILHPNETVIDHSMGQSGATIVNQTINLSAGVSQTVRAEVMGMMPRIMEATKSAVADAKRRGGSFGKAMA